jgi:hypothetical protein
MSRLGLFCNASVQKQEDSIVVNLREAQHPGKTPGGPTQYQYDVILLCWTGTEGPAQHDMQGTNWMDIDGKLKQFEFVFENTSDITHWLLCLHQFLGSEDKRIETMKGEGMMIVNAGSFDEEELALLNKEQELVKEQPVVKEKTREVKRVGPKEL